MMEDGGWGFTENDASISREPNFVLSLSLSQFQVRPQLRSDLGHRVERELLVTTASCGSIATGKHRAKVEAAVFQSSCSSE